MDPTLEPPILTRRTRNSIWGKLGGGALTFAVILHALLLILGAVWIFQVIHEPEKKVDFIPAGGGTGGERGAKTQVQQKKRAQITPSTHVKRVFAEGVSSDFALPDPGDSFGEMAGRTLYQTRLARPMMKADLAPAAFDCEKEV